MVIRKPYAFLIKNFKLIHLFMFILSLYVLYKTGIMLSFFNEYVTSREVLEGITYTDYISGLLYFSSIILIILSLGIYILFKEKKKPVTFYLLHIIYFICFIILLVVTSNLITTIVKEGIDPRISRILRDFWLMFLLAQVYFIVIIFIRTIGFDFKKFNFGEDLAQLSIEEEDSEEIELNANFNIEKTKMQLAMKKEDWKFFIVEYKKLIITIGIILFIIIPGVITVNKVIESKVYSENEVIELDNLSIKIVESYITKKNYDGSNIYKNNNSFVIVKIKVQTKKEDLKLELENIKLKINDTFYSATTSYNEKFSDIGKCYDNQIVTNDSEYLIIYIVEDSKLEEDLIIRYRDKIGYKNGELVGKYYKIRINPENIDQNNNTYNYVVGDKLEFNEFKNTSLVINEYKIDEYYKYNYNNKINYIINNTGLVLNLNYNFYISDSSLIKTFNELLTSYGKIRYVYNGRTYTNSIKIINSNGYGNNNIFIAVNEDIFNASSIELLMNLRNNSYIYKIK